MASILNNIEESPNTQRGPSSLSGAFGRSSGPNYLYLS